MPFLNHGAFEHTIGALEITFCSFSSTIPLDCLTQLA